MSDRMCILCSYKGYHSHSFLNWISDEQASWSIDLLILLLNVCGNLFNHLLDDRKLTVQTVHGLKV